MTTVAGSSVLATNEIRIDGRDKVSGRMAYTADIHRPRELWAAFNVAVPAALANAVADAAGVRLFHFPITAERVYDALRSPRQSGTKKP